MGYNSFNIYNNVDALLAKIKSTSTPLKKELANSKGGNLYIKRYKNYNIFTEYAKGVERSIGRDMRKVHKLARRKYISLLVKYFDYGYKQLKKSSINIAADNIMQDISLLINQYESLGLDMNRILLSPEQQEWLNQPYERNPAYPEELKFKTTNNNLMRTKSELIIANRLEHYGIPYLPEKPLWFDYDMYPKYPDFTILKANGDTVIWEHMGLMDREDYFIKNSRKIIEYRQNGYSQNTNLIITFEEDIIEPGLIDHIIESRILS